MAKQSSPNSTKVAQGKGQARLATIFLTVFLDMLGIGIIIPIVAPLLLDTNTLLLDTATPFAQRTLIMGLLISSFSIAQFFGASVLGSLSDKHGRKRILLLSITGSALGYALFAYGIISNQLWLLFFGRSLNGFMAGNLAVMYSAIADISTPESKSKNFGLVGAAFGMGFVIGPFLGGQLANPDLVSWFSYATPFWTAAVLSLVNVLLIGRFFGETLLVKINKAVRWSTGILNLRKAFGNPRLRAIFTVGFLFVFGFTFFTQFFQVYLIEKFDFRESDIGWLFGYMGLWIALTQGAIIRPVMNHFKPAQVIRLSTLCLALALLGLLVPVTPWQIYVVIPLVSIFQGLTTPNIMATVSNLAGAEIQGEILGINQSVNSFGQLLPPMIGGILVGLDIRMPLIVSAGFMLMAWLVFTIGMARGKHQPAG